MNKKKLIQFDKTKWGFPSETRIFLNESLCPAYRDLFYKCNELRKQEKIKSVWTYNGMVKIRLNDDSVHKVEHKIDFDNISVTA